MSSCAILASGKGSNARAIARQLPRRHTIAAIISDRRKSRVVSWAQESGYTAIHVRYRNRAREDAECELAETISNLRADLIVLAGFMRVLSPSFVDHFVGRIVNIHPSLLPAHPGLHAIERSWESDDDRSGVSIHWVDQGVDTGPTIAQVSFSKASVTDFNDFEQRIHAIEHAVYPVVVTALLDNTNTAPCDSAVVSRSQLEKVIPDWTRLEVP